MLAQLEEPLEADPAVFIFDIGDSGGMGCSTPIELKANHGNLIELDDRLILTGSLFAESPLYGPLRFASGSYTLMRDESDPNRITGITGDGLMLVPGVGVMAGLETTTPVRAKLSVLRGSDLQNFEVPVPNDNRCYFFFEIIAGAGNFAGKTSNFGFSLGANAQVVMDPTDPLLFFRGKLTGGKKTKFPGIKEAIPVEEIAIGISAQGLLTSTATAIPDRIITGHIYFGAEFDIPGTPFQVSGEIIVRLPDASSLNPDMVLAVDGSVFLQGAELLEIIPLPGITSDLFHVGDGTGILEFGFQLDSDGQLQQLPNVRLEFAVNKADMLGKLSNLTNSLLGDVLNASGVSTVSGLVDTDPFTFTFDVSTSSRLTLLGNGFNFSNAFHTGSLEPVFEWKISGGVDFGPFSSSALAFISSSGALRITASSSLGGSAEGCIAKVCVGVSFHFHANMVLAFPNTQATVAGDVEACGSFAGVEECADAGLSFNFGSPEVCFSAFGATVCVP